MPTRGLLVEWRLSGRWPQAGSRNEAQTLLKAYIGQSEHAV